MRRRLFTFRLAFRLKLTGAGRERCQACGHHLGHPLEWAIARARLTPQLGPSTHAPSLALLLPHVTLPPALPATRPAEEGQGAPRAAVDKLGADSRLGAPGVGRLQPAQPPRAAAAPTQSRATHRPPSPHRPPCPGRAPRSPLRSSTTAPPPPTPPPPRHVRRRAAPQSARKPGPAPPHTPTIDTLRRRHHPPTPLPAACSRCRPTRGREGRPVTAPAPPAPSSDRPIAGPPRL